MPQRDLHHRITGDASSLERASERGARSMSKMDREARRLERQQQQLDRAMGQVARSAGVAGAGLDSAAGDARQLDRAIDELGDEISRLNRELLRTGDIEVFAKLEEQRSTLQVLKRMRREIGDVEDEARGLSFALSEMFRALPAQLKGIAIVGISGTVIAIAPLIGAAVAAAVLGGVGAGGIAGGLASAARDPRVQDAAGDLVDRLEGRFAQLGDAFVDPAVDALNILAEAGAEVLARLDPQISALAPTVTDLATAIGDMGRRAVPGIAAALEASQPVLDALAQELPELGEAFGDMLETIAEDPEGAAAGLRTLFNMVETTLRVTGQLVAFLSDAFAQLARNADTFQALIDRIPLAGEAFRIVSGDAADTTVRFRDFAEEGVAATGAVAAGFGDVKVSVHGATQELQRHIDTLRAQSDPMFALLNAQQQMRTAQQNLNDAVEEHGRGSEQARQAQVDLAEAAVDLVGASGDAAGAFRDGLTPQMAAAFEAAGLTKREIDDLREIMEQAGRQAQDTRDDFEALAGRYVVQVTTEFATRGTPPIRGGRVALQHGGEVHGPPGVDRVPAMLTRQEFVVRAAAAQPNLAALKALNATGRLPVSGVRGGDGPATGRVAPDEFTATAVLDLGEGIEQAVDIKFVRRLSDRDRQARRVQRQGSGAAR